MFPVLLGLTSGLVWGVGDFLGGTTARRYPPVAVAFWSQFFGAVYLGVLVGIIGPEYAAEGVAWGVIAGAFTGLGLVCFYRGVAIGAMAIVAPISAASAVVPLIVAFARGEAPSTAELAGILLVLLGVVILSIPSERANTKSARPFLVVAFALGAALFWGLFYVFVDFGADTEAAPIWVIFGARLGAMVSVSVSAMATRTRIPSPRQFLLVLVALGLMDSTANVLFAWASTEGNIAVVSVLGSLYPVTTIALAWLVTRERVATYQYGAAAVALAGVAALAAA